MYWKHKIHIYLICVLIVAQAAYAASFLDTIRGLLSWKIPEDIFASVNEEIVGKLKAKNIKFIVPNKIEMDDMEVLDEFGERVLYGKHVKLTIALISLLTNNIRITDAYVDSPFFRYTVHKDVHNVVRVFESKVNAPSGPSKLRVTIEKISVEKGSYEMYHDAGVEIFAENIAASGTFWVEKGPFLVNIYEATIESGAIFAGGLDLPITNLVTKNLWISDEKVATDNLVATYEKAHVTGRGTVFIDKDYYDILATIDAPKNTYPKGLKPLPFLAPAFRGQVTMAGALTEPEFLADISVFGTEFNGLNIGQGRIRAQINPSKVIIESANIRVGEIGSVFGNGTVDIDNKTYDFHAKQKDIYAHELAQFLSLKRKVNGLFAADTKMQGSFVGADQNMQITTEGNVSHGGIDELTLSKKTSFSLNLNLVLEKSVVIKSAHVADDHSKLSFSGHGNLLKKSIDLNFDLYCAKVANYVPIGNDIDEVNGLKAQGSMAYDTSGLILETPIRVHEIKAKGLSATDIKAQVEFVNDRLDITSLSGKAYRGEFSADLIISEFKDKKYLKGNAIFNNIQLHPPTRRFTSTNIAGSISGSLKIDGSLENPKIGFLTTADDLFVDEIRVRNAQAEGQLDKKSISIFNLSSTTNSGSFLGQDLLLDFDSKRIAGTGMALDLNIKGVLSKYFDKVDGDVSGPIYFEGTLDKPHIMAPFRVSRFSVMGIKLGNGELTLGLAHRPLLGLPKEADLVFSASANVGGADFASIARFAIALNKKTINAEVKFNNLEINSTQFGLFDNSLGIVGQVSGEIAAEGPLFAPSMKANLIAKEYALFDPKASEESIVKASKKYHGPAVIQAVSDSGKLAMHLCASLSEPMGKENCEESSAITLSLKGPYNKDSYSFDFSGRIDHDHLEDLIIDLKNELITLNGAAHIDGKISKVKGGPISYEASGDIERLVASLPNIPSIKLKERVPFTLFPYGIVLDNEAVLLFEPGKLVLRGSFSKSAADLHLDGEIPLVLTRLFVPFIQSAEGLASGDIALSGALDRLIAEGRVTPQPGSVLTPKKWLEPIEVKEGTISFKKTSTRSFAIEFDKIKLAVGDGRLSIDGTFDKNYERESTFSLMLQGSNIILRDRLNFIEADFNLSTKQQDGSPMTKGDVTITDGSAYRQFDLRNFVIEAESRKLELSKFLDNIDMELDIDIAVRQFRAEARMLNLNIDSVLRGQLTLLGPIAHPKFKGSLYVSEGAVIFPSVSFDLMETQIELNDKSQRIFDPKIEISATQELSEKEFPLNNDTTIELSLRGDLDRLNLELKSIGGDRLTQLKIFLLLLSPRSISDREKQFDVKQGAQNAAMALSGEVFLRPLTNELQELIESRTKTRIQFGSAIEPGGVSVRLTWKLGPRIELQGSYLYLNERLGAERSSLPLETYYPIGDLKLKLLLFDHRPAGPLFFESSFGSIRQFEGSYEPRGKIRLKYGVLSK